MTGTIKKTTPHLNLRIPVFDSPGWGRELERNFDILDAVTNAIGSMTGVRGIWLNGYSYNEWDSVVDPEASQIFVCVIAHTSPQTGTFAEFRAANPGYWEVQKPYLTNRGAWAMSTPYAANELVISGARIGIVATLAYTSSSSYDQDVLDGNLVTVIDLTSYISYVDNSAINALNSANNAQASAVEAQNWADLAANGAIAGGDNNLFMNAGFWVNQRGYAGTLLSDGVFGYDRWCGGQNTGLCLASGSLLTFSGEIIQPIEAFDKSFANRVITVSVENPSDPIGIKCYPYDTLSSSTILGYIPADSGWQSFTFTVPSDVTSHMMLGFAAGSGVTIGRNVQANFGPDRLPYRARRPGEDMQQCMRYYYKTLDTMYPPLLGTALSNRYLFFKFSVPMHRTPDIVFASSAGTPDLSNNCSHHCSLVVQMSDITSAPAILAGATFDAEIV